MSIRKKFIIYFLIIFLVFGSIAFYSIWHSFSVNKSLNEKIPQSIDVIQKASKQNTVAQLVRYDDEVLTQSARNYAFTGDKKWKDRYYQFVPKLDLRIKEAIDFGDAVDIAIFDSIKNSNDVLVSLEKKAIDNTDNKKIKSAQDILNSDEYSKQKDIFKNGVDKYLARRGIQIDATDPVSTQFLKDTQDFLSVHFKMSIYSILILVFVFLLTIFFLFFIMFKTFMVPLSVFKKIARRITEGDLNAKVEINNKDEIGDFAIDFNKMTENLRNLYKNLDEKVQEKTKEVMDQKSAILNILEDVEREKNNVENLANDLEKFKLAVDNASDQVTITDSEGIVIYGNKAIENITGYKPEETIGKKAGVLWKTPMPQEYYKNMWHIIKEEKKVFVGEIQNKRKGGELYVANISISPVLNDKNEIIYFVAIEHDITKEKEIDKAKTEFVSLASHQLRTPLSAINWYTEMLLAGDAGGINDEQKKYLNEVAIGNKRMVELVDALLNVSRLDLGTFIIEPESTNVVEMAQSVVNELKPQIIEKKLKVEEVYGGNIKEFQADKKLLRIVIQNLLSNSVKYTQVGGSVKINVSVVSKGEIFGEKIINEEDLAFVISDSGMGIPTNQQEKVFSKLFRADNARESETEGTGLGLYIIKSIVDQSGGSIWFKSEENKGTTFFVLFPITGMKKKEGTKNLD